MLQKAGILNKEMEVVTPGIEDDLDPFDDLDTEGDLLPEQCPQLRHVLHMSILIVITLSLCVQYDDDTEEDCFFTVIGESPQWIEYEADLHDGDKESLDISSPPPKIQSFQVATKALEEVKQFLDSHGRVAEATKASSLVNYLASLNTCYQTSIFSYFH